MPVIFLDQFVFNKIAKSLYNNSGPKKEEDLFWQEIFDCMVRLAENKKCKFPWSPFHEEETLTFEEHDKVKQVSNKVTLGLFFKIPDLIFIEQVHENVTAWVNNKNLSKIKLKTERILECQENKNVWINWQPGKNTEDWRRLKNNTIDSRSNVRKNILQCYEFSDNQVFSSKKGDEAIRSHVNNQHSKYL